jgi:hypothetical protein
MSSRTGPRAAGTDGSDFYHRETVANHYKTSVTNKARMKLILILHLMMAFLMLFRLSTSLCVLFGHRPPSSLQQLKLPKAMTWEFVWLFSLLPTIMGLLSLNRNRMFFMQQYLIGGIIFALAPTVYAMYDLSDDLKVYWGTKKVGLQFMGFPMIVIWYMFLAICFQLHIFGTYFSFQLLKTWNLAQSKGKKTK